MDTTFVTPNLWPAMPEIFLLTMGCIVLLVDLFMDQPRRYVTFGLSMATLVGLALISSSQLNQPDMTSFGGMYVADTMAHVLKMVAYAVVATVFVYSRNYLADRDLYKGEFFTLGLFALLGIMVMISAHHFVPLYLGLELMSLSLYGMVALHRDNGIASEAAMKYFVLGAIASGLLLYGMSILYGVSGTLDIGKLSDYVAAQDAPGVGLMLGIVFVVVGMAFKFGAVPFHMWVPDVYDGAPTAVTLFIGSAPKLAAFAMFMRLLADGLGAAVGTWQSLLIVMSLLSMAIGSIVAIAQTSAKRMLAYSTISHVGFIFLGILAGTEEGYQAAMFYTIIYVIMATAGFGMILLLARGDNESDQLSDFAGLGRRNPWLAVMMTFVMFGMAGVPPFAGFYAKFSVILAVVQAGMSWLAVAAVIFSVISAYYYLRLVKIMYFDEPTEGLVAAEPALDTNLVMSANGLLILALGILPGGLMAVCLRAIGF